MPKNTSGDQDNRIICSESIKDIIDLENMLHTDDKKISAELHLSNDDILVCDFVEVCYIPEIITVNANINFLELFFKHKILKIVIKFNDIIIKHFDTNKNHVISVMSLKNIENTKLKISMSISGSGILK